MISDDERRKVAQRMRRKICFMYDSRDWYESGKDVVECGSRAYRDIADSVIRYSHFGNDYIGVVERLADIIDRPMGIATKAADGYAKCHSCGANFTVSVPAAFRCEEETEADYCPFCGTPLEWRDEDD